MNKKPLVIIAGPTGVGKSKMGIELAKLIDGEIISADSIQVYRGFDIGSAKASITEMEGVPHHLIDVLNPDEDFGVNIFVDMAKNAIDDILKRGHIPIIVGGTAFYIQALLLDVDFTEEDDNKSIRNDLIAESNTPDGNQMLYERLVELDPDYASIVHPNNSKRVIRALEYIASTGRRFSEYNNEQSKRPINYNYLYFALTDNRQKLYERIDRRVDSMVDAGLVDEVRGLLDSGVNSDWNCMQGIGYRELVIYFKNECTLDEAIEKIKQNSRHYCKRQLTWLRREKNVDMISREDYSDDREILNYMRKKIKDAGIR